MYQTGSQKLFTGCLNTGRKILIKKLDVALHNLTISLDETKKKNRISSHHINIKYKSAAINYRLRVEVKKKKFRVRVLKEKRNVLSSRKGRGRINPM